MGAGRKTSTYTYDSKNDPQGPFNFESVSLYVKLSKLNEQNAFLGSKYVGSSLQRQRNLGEALGGCIFGRTILLVFVAFPWLYLAKVTCESSAGCTNETMKECLEDQVFGLPRAHWCYVQARYSLACITSEVVD